MSYSQSNSSQKGSYNSQASMAAQFAKEEIFPNYEEYLLLLQEKNRLVKKLKQKDKKQIALEKKEKGFSLYVNGANAGRRNRAKPVQVSPNQCRPKTRQAKTAGDYPRKLGLNPADLHLIQQEEARQFAEKDRVKTAPAKGRKNWAVNSIDIQTARGVKERLKAPRDLTGNYEDDFESDESEGEFDRTEVVRSVAVSLDAEDSDEDIEIDAAKFNSQHERKLTKRQPMTNRKKFTSKYLKRRAELENNNNNCCDEDGEEPGQLILTIQDVKKLRESLEMNRSIQQSLAQEVSSLSLPKLPAVSGAGYSDNGVLYKQALSPGCTDSCTDSCTFYKQESDEDSVILEESDEEIEEDLTPALESLSLSGERNPLQPGDTIVLELATPINNKVERNLSAARKKTADVETPRKQTPSRSKRSPPSYKSEELRGSVSRKPSRPLSGCRKNSEVKKDSPTEAKAVLEALKAENQRVSQYTHDTPTTPRKYNQMEDKDSVDPPLSARERRRMKTPRSPHHASSPNVAVPLPSDTDDSHLSDKTSMLTPEKLWKITDQVSSMAPRQQKNLVKMLGKLEESLSQPVDKNSSIKIAEDITDTTQSDPQSMGEVLDLRLDILSNWGDKERVGLTELQPFDSHNKLIPVLSHHVSIHGAQGARGDHTCLFNSKCKTNKERNMWSCKYTDGQSIKIHIKVHNPQPGKTFHLSKLKIWNFNKSINDLRIGVRACRVYLSGKLLFGGEIEKGCGNQVFDYSTTITIPSGQKDESAASENNGIQTFSGSNGSVDISPKLSKSSQKSTSKPQNCHNVPQLPKSTRRSISPSPNRENKKTFPSLRESPSSSGSSLGDVKFSSKISPSTSQEELPQRSKTRTLNHSGEKQLQRPAVTSQPSSPDSDQPDDVKCMRGGGKSPRKSKRMAARLSGHSSTELNGSKSYLDSLEARPPRPPDNRSEDRQRGSSLQELQPYKDSEDSLFAVPKLGQLPKSLSHEATPHPDTSLFSPRNPSRRPGWLDNMLQDNVEDADPRSIPSWLKREEIDDYFDNPPENQCVSRLGLGVVQSGKDSRQELLDWDDDISANWPTPGVPYLSTVFDDGLSQPKPKSPINPEALDECTPMQRIQKNRSKWRDSQQKKLEESWGSLNLFNRSHRGRLSVDMTDDVLDEYLVPSKKSSSKAVNKPQPRIAEPAVEEEDFIIPELPYGRNLEINIRTTWGDKHYVGLTGVDIFSHTGDPVQVSKIVADPKDINILADYGKDPRVVTNLIDGVNRTRDDVHMWLAPFTTKSNHFVHITFEKPCRVAMIRVWNYNKSRIHSYRGAKDVEMKLDGCLIFQGEIARACGGIEGGTEAFGDTILFSIDEDILEAVSKHDAAFEGNGFSDDEIEDDVPFERPSTADDGKDERPFTRATGLLKSTKDVEEMPRPQTGAVTVEGNVLVYKGQKLELNFTSTWGDPHYMGLTGLEVIGKDGEALPVTLKKLHAKPRDVRVLPGHEEDDRTLDKLIDGTNITVSDEHMWLIPFTDGQNHTLTVDFGQKVLMAGLRIWNYNKSSEDTYRGAKIVHIKVDSRLISPPDGFLIRKGPGNCYFDYAQEISFSPDQKTKNPQQSGYIPDSLSPGSSVDVPSQEYEAVQMPCGFIYQFHLLSTWGDPYYVGLNGLEFYDGQFNQIQLAENNIAAYPDSVNVLDNVKNDVRTPDKLIDGWNDTTDGRHMWIAPVLPHVVNRVYVIFDQPTSISMIKLWNYSKTPNRGTKDFALLVDDLLVYNGVLNSVGEAARGILPTCSTQSYHTILFSDNKELLRKERHTVISKPEGEQDIQMLNDKKIVTHYSDPKKAQANKPVNQALRPKTSVPAMNKRR